MLTVKKPNESALESSLILRPDHLEPELLPDANGNRWRVWKSSREATLEALIQQSVDQEEVAKGHLIF